MRRLIAVIVAAFWGLGAAQALACVPGPEQQHPNRPADYRRFAEATVREATFVEVVEVESVTPVMAPEAWDRWLAAALKRGYDNPTRLRAHHKANRHKPVGVRFRLKVVERLKGQGPAHFLLDGGGVARSPTGDGREFSNVIRKGRAVPFLFMTPVDQLVLPDGPPPNSCTPASLHLAKGQRYLVFRGREGRLLNTGNGYRLVAVNSGNGARNWIAAVRQAAGRRQTDR